MTIGLSILAAVLYAIATWRLARALNRQDTVGGPLTLSLAAIALALHAVVVIGNTGWPENLSLPFFTALAAAAVGVVLLQLILSLQHSAHYLGLLIYPIAAITLLLSHTAGRNAIISDAAIQVHVLLSLMAYSVFTVAAAQAILVAVQRHFLSEHKPGGFMRALPPLDAAEGLLFALLGVGLVFLTLSLASGFFYLEDMFAQHLVHKTVLSCLAWIIFAMLLFGRWKFGWRGRRAVHWTFGGFAMLILAYFGSKFVLELLLERG